MDENTGDLTVCDYIQCRLGVAVYENLITRLPVSVENDSVVIHGEKHCAILHAEGRKGEFKIKTVEHYNHQGILENINVIRWEVCCDEPQNSKIGIADSKICLPITE